MTAYFDLNYNTISTKNQNKMKQVLLICAVFIAKFSAVTTEHAYFLLNSECSDVHTCVGEVRDISVVCLNSRCICDPRLGIYDFLRYQCVGKADHACLGNLCTRNSNCDSTSNTCHCQDGYQLSPDGRCVHGHEEICEEDEDCKRGLLCYDGLCECRYPNHQYYHPGNETCYSIAHSWDSNFRKDFTKESFEFSHPKSTLLEFLEVLFLLIQAAVLVAIAVLLARTVSTLKCMIVGFKLHGYLLRSGLETKGTDNATLKMQIDEEAFFSGDVHA